MSVRSTPAWDFFVCYAEPDRGWVEHFLLEELRTAGVRCLTQAGLTPGAFQAAEFERAVAESPRVLLVFSAAYRADVNQRLLDNLARYHELENETESVIPLLLDGTPPPLGIRAKVSLRATTDEEKAAVVKRLAGLCQAGPVPPPVVPKCPYPGMAPFDRKDADLFHGRRDEVEELLQILRHRNYLFLIGRSGSGKSSLVMAGLLPQLEAGRTVRVLRPGSAPRARLEALDWGGEAGRRLLVVDQFEELYTQARPEEAVSFQQALCAWVTAPERMLLVTVRADFYADLQASLAIFPLFQASHRDVLPLDTRALREAIVEPAARANVFVEPDLVERLLADAADEPGVLPHLQETMQLLWGKLRRRYLPIEAYRELGRDGRTGLQQAMAVVGDAAVGDLPPAELALARRTLLRLVQFGEGRADTRRSQPLSALESAADPPGALDHVLGRLVTRRLVVAGVVRMGAAETTVIDLAHEALIAGWPTLQDWVKEYRAAEQTRRRLTEKAREWEGFGQKAGLLDEVELSEAEQWLARHVSEMGASAELLALVRASRAKIEADRAYDRRRRRNVMVGLSVVLVIISGLAVWGFTMAANSRLEAHVANAILTQKAWEADGDVDAASSLLDQQFDIRMPWDGDLRGFEWYLWWRRCHRDLGPPRRQDYEVKAVAFAGADALVSVTGDKTPPVQVACWNAKGGQEWAQELTNPYTGDEFLRVVSLSADGRKLALAGGTSSAGFVTLWDVGPGKSKASPFEEKFKGAASCLGFSADSRILAVGSASQEMQNVKENNGEICAWDTASRRLLFHCAPGLKAARALVFDGRGLLVVAGERIVKFEGRDKLAGCIKLFEADTGKEDPNSSPLIAAADLKVTCLAFSGDGKTLAAGTDKGIVHTWKFTEKGIVTGQFSDPASSVALRCLAFAPGDSPLLAAGGDDHTIRLWNFEKGELRDDTLKHSKPVVSLAFSGDGKTLASGGLDRQVKLWAVPDGDVLETPQRKLTDTVLHLAFSPDGSLLATACDKTALLWNVATGRPATPALDKAAMHTDFVHAVAFSHDGKLLASGSEDGAIKFWNPATGAHLASLDIVLQPPGVKVEPKNRVYALAFAADGALAAATEDGSVLLVQPGGGAPLARANLHDKAVYQLAWSPDSTILASASADGKVLLWDKALNPRLRQPQLPKSSQEVWSVAFSPPGQPLALATGSSDQLVRIWDVENAVVTRSFPCSGARVHDVAFSADGSTLAAASQDLELWNLRTGRLHASLRDPNKEQPISVAFSPAVKESGGRSRTLALGSNNGTIRFWRAATESEVRARSK